MSVRPLYDRLLLRRIEEPEDALTPGGLVIPDNAKEKPQEGEVLAVGSGRLMDSGVEVPLKVQVGDHVLFGKFSGTDIKVDGVEVLILREDELLAVIEQPSAFVAAPDDVPL